MPIVISAPSDIAVGAIYEDAFYHPCLCIGNDGETVWGISLVDGTYPRSEDLQRSGLRTLSPEEAWIWRTKGPQDVELESKYRWW